ncbi:MAG: class I SAM-dependent rRNA methyltransferase [Planctomycetes bacterium]|nr:class I SAM-dependent rRNA methyltransferase [Planctomycetota bacterium]
MRTVVVRKGHAKPLWFGHPWVFAEAIASLGKGDDDWVAVVDEARKPIGRGWLSPKSALRVRIVDRDPRGADEETVVARRLEAAVALRRRLFPDPMRTDAYRLVHGEGDGLPGLVVDRFGSVLVAQFSTRPLVRRREALARRLLALTGATSLVGRPGGKEAEEGIAEAEVAFAAGSPAPTPVVAREDGLLFEVDVQRGQKTGHYADQRENRRAVAEVAGGGRVLDLFAGSCGFSVAALRAGAAAAEAVDSSAGALLIGTCNAERNGVGGRLRVVESDAGERLDALARAKTSFDVVVSDPPRFAPARAGLERALNAYRAVHGKALARVAPGGFAAVFSCSGAVEPAVFADVVRAALRDVARTATVLRVLAAGPDHPVGLAAPEGRYLTGLLLRLDP